MRRKLANIRIERPLVQQTAGTDSRLAAAPCARAFTLIELLVATVILLIIVVVSINLLGQTTNIWRNSVQQVQAFQSARLAFDLVTRDLSQCTLNSYLEYMDGQTAGGATPGAPYFASEPGYSGVAARYARRSDLHFVCAYPGMDIAANTIATDSTKQVPGTTGTGTAVFFQAPIGYTVPTLSNSGTTVSSDAYNGLETLLNPVGFYVQFGPDSVPPHVQTNSRNVKYRYRLKQLLVPSNLNTIYPLSYNPYNPASVTTGSSYANYLAYDPGNPARWFCVTNPATNLANYSNDVADNVIALIVRVQDPTNPNLTGSPLSYVYDSHNNERVVPQPVTANQVPPYLLVTMIAVDETSALRLDSGNNMEPAALRALLNPSAPVSGARFTDQTQYSTDLASFESGLQNLRINYRVFATAVPIRESKWAK